MTPIGVTRSFARNVLPYLLWFARAVTPARSVAVVHGYPAAEGNAIETVRALEQTNLRRVYWLDSPGSRYAEELGVGLSGKVRHVSRSSVRGMVAYVLARFTFFTHGLYGVPPALRRKPTVNVWHGEAIKKFDPLLPHRTSRGRPADYHVGSTARFARASALASHRRRPPVVIESGYPRTAQLLQPADDSQVATFGIDPRRPFVVWVPTFRQAKAVGATAAWSDAASTSAGAITAVMERMVPELRRFDVQLVVKPHPLDAENRAIHGAVVINDQALVAANVPFYHLLGRAAGLITDFSSVANEYLVLDRPIAYFFPDAAAYRSGRGLQIPDALEHLAGPVLRTNADMAEFAAAVLCPSSSAAQRAEAHRWFGPLGTADSGMRMIVALAQAGEPIRWMDTE